MRNNYEAAFVNNTTITKQEAQRVICITPRTKESEKFVFSEKHVFINFFFLIDATETICYNEIWLRYT